MFPYNRVKIQLRVSSCGPSCFELFREGKHVVDVDDSKSKSWQVPEPVCGKFSLALGDRD